MTTYVKGVFVKNIYQTADGYLVGLLKVIDSNDDDVMLKKNKTIHFVGTFFDLKIRNKYVFYGKTNLHPKYGFQFDVINYEYVEPRSNEEIIGYLQNKKIGISAITATKIVEKLGSDTIKEILNDYEVLLDIPLMNDNKARMLYQNLKDNQTSNQIIINLTKMGFTTNQSFKLYNKYGLEITNIINDNIYNIVDDLEFLFNEVDNISLSQGMNICDERRVCATILYQMRMFASEIGSTCLRLQDIIKKCSRYFNDMTSDELEYHLSLLVNRREVVIEDELYYLKIYYDAEKYITNRLLYLNSKPATRQTKIKSYLAEIEKWNNIVYDTSQKKAIVSAIKNRVSIITGGPGTGKTVIIKAIVTLLQKYYKVPRSAIAMLAPTGRAAKRMSMSMIMPASTIHRFLKWNKDTGEFMVNEFARSEVDYIIIDEASMVDTLLFCNLLKGLKSNVNLIIVGDHNQLPSVGAGQVLKDLIDSDLFETIILNKLYRQNKNSYIVSLAQEIRCHELSDTFMNLKDDYSFINASGEDLVSKIESLIEQSLNKGLTDQDVQVLVPMYKGINGINNLNKVLQAKYNPQNGMKTELSYGEIVFRVGDKVIQLINDVENNVFNGDIGYIKNVTLKPKKQMIIDFDGENVIYNGDMFKDIKHAYAMSVHKAQGNEFKTVILPLDFSYYNMLYNKLIYTAVTRAKKLLIIVGNPQAFVKGVMTDNDEMRLTTLKKFLQNEV